MKIVIDTNVFISALLWQGLPNKLLIPIEEKALTLCITPLLLEEMRDVLMRPKFSSRIEKLETSYKELLAKIIDIAELYLDKKIISAVKDDPSDDKILSCALTSGAEYIITGDLHLLKLKKWHGINILTTRKFLNHIHYKYPE